MTFDIKSAVAQAAAQGPNMNDAQKGGGGDYKPPVEGPVNLRLVTYIELGVVTEDFKGQPKKREKVYLGFELFGKNYPPREDGTPQFIGFTETLSLNEKANFYKLFARLNHDKTKTHFAEFLGGAFIGKVVHNIKGEGDNARTYANLRDKEGYTINPPYRETEVEDPDTGETEIVSKLVKVPEPTMGLRLFLWNFPSKEMWDSIFIDGEYEAKTNDKGEVTQPAKSKNYFQNRIMAAENFAGSPIAELLAAGGVIDIPDAETPARTEADAQAANDAKTGAAADPLMEAA